MKDFFVKEWKNFTQDFDKKTCLTLIFATIIIFLYCYFGTFSFFEKVFGDVQNVSYYKIIYHNSMSFVLFFCVGLLFVKFVLKEKLTNFGLGFGDKKFGIWLMLIATFVVPLVAILTIFDADMCATYPLVDLNENNEFWQIALYYFSYVLYYIGWEFLFRGILLFGLKDKFGVLGAIFVTVLISALIHTCIANFGKPMIETLSAIFAGVIFGYIANRTHSIYYSFYVHLLVGVFTDIFIFFLC